MKTIVSATIATTLLAAASSAWADDISTVATITPANGQYVASRPIVYANGVVLNDFDITDLTPTDLPGSAVGDTFPAKSFFDVFVDISIPGSPPIPPSFGHGNTDTIVQRLTGSGDTGTFGDTFSGSDGLNISGLPDGLPDGASIRIDPTAPSTGETTITGPSGGPYRIYSFFDVFTDISLDGGNTWVPSTGPTVLTLQPVPDTGATLQMLLLPVALLALGASRRKACP
jgi:hypothetical protein